MSRVGCVGLVVEDSFCGPLAALPPAGSLTLLDSMPIRAGGCAANVAIDLVRQGIEVDILGCIGAGGGGDRLAASLNSAGVGIARLLQLDGEETSRTTILLIEGEDRRYFHLSGANDALLVAHIDRTWVASLDILYLGGLFALRGLDFAELAELLAFARSVGVLTVVDVVVPHEPDALEDLRPLLPYIDVFLPNEDEAGALTGLSDPHDQLRALQHAGANLVIITRGRLGAIASRGSESWSCGAYHMQSIDPSGSGDAFTSGVIRGLSLGWDVARTLRYASAVGASATRASGTTDAVFSAEEAETFIETHPLAVTHEP